VVGSEVSAHELSIYTKSLDELEQIIATDVLAGQMPRQSDMRAGELLSAVTDAKRFLENERYSQEELGALAIACNRTIEIYKKYLLFGVQDPDSALRVPRLSSKDVRDTAKRNVSNFQPELTRLEIFNLQCAAKQTSLVGEVATKVDQTQATHDAFRPGIQQMRVGCFAVYLGALVKATEDVFPISISYKLQLAAVLSDKASTFSEIFTPDLREVIVRRLTTQVASISNDELRMHIARIIQVMSDPQCKGLCKY
jgi:hypothetical protein